MKRRHALWLMGGLVSCEGKKAVTEWRGICFGIPVSIKFRGVEYAEAQKIGDESLKVGQEYETAFSLWDEQSELSRLNRDGVLLNPSEHLREALGRSLYLHKFTEGLFDPTIHSYLEWIKAEYAEGRVPDPEVAKKKRALVDFSHVRFWEKEVRLTPGMALSFNGIAQGIVTDRIAEFLAEKGLRALVNFGEYRVVGSKPWIVSVEGNDISLTQALAVSSGSGERLSATQSANHLIDPNTGESPPPKKVIAVEAPKAWLADGLATTIAVGGEVPEVFQGVTVRFF